MRILSAPGTVGELQTLEQNLEAESRRDMSKEATVRTCGPFPSPGCSAGEDDPDINTEELCVGFQLFL